MVTRHKIDAPVSKGANDNDRVKMVKHRMHLVLIDISIMELTNINDVVFKDGGPEIPSMNNFLCSSITRHVTTTGPTVIIIQKFLSLLES